MKIWIYVDGRQEGPYTLEELLDKQINENTKVWFEGLPKWYPAGSLEQLRPLFDGTIARQQAQQEIDEVIEETTTTEPEPHSTVSYQPYKPYQPQAPEEPCPPTFIGWTIFLTICCCSPISIAALAASICTSVFYNNCNLAKAKKASEITEWLIMIAIALGFIPVVLMSMLW